MVEFVNYYIVKLVSSKSLEMCVAAERLNRREQHLGIRPLLRPIVVSENRVRSNRAESAHRLAEDLLAVSDEQDTAEGRTAAVEGAEPGLPQAGSEYDEACRRPRSFQ